MDFITYVPDLSAMIAEAISIQSDEESQLARYFTIENGRVSFDVSKITVEKSKDNQSVCVVRGISRAVIESSTTIRVIGHAIGTDDYEFYEDGQAIYESIHDTKPRMLDDGYGGQYSFTPSYKMGGFA